MGYEYLRETYPAVISAEQFYRICRISKRKASWLLKNGVIPCSDSGKRTRRFQIRLDDVIDYLSRCDAGELDDVIPIGAFSSGSVHRPQLVMDSEALCAFILATWSDAPDMLRSKEASALCGPCRCPDSGRGCGSARGRGRPGPPWYSGSRPS